MALQAVYKSGFRSSATARRLIAQTSIAPHILSSTMEYDGGERQVITMQVMEPAFIGSLTLEANEVFYLVASKFANRYYILTKDGKCSSADERVAAACRAKVEAFKLAMKKAA